MKALLIKVGFCDAFVWSLNTNEVREVAVIEAKVSRLSMIWWLSFSVGVDLDDPTANVRDVAP